MTHFTRREFLKSGLATGAFALSGALPLGAQRGSATDVVTLGRSGVKVTRLAFGTGSFSGRVQRELGQDGFTRLVRHAYDRGIRFFETDRQKAMRFAFRNAGVDCVTVGYKSPAEVDEAIENLNLAFTG